MDLSYFDCKLCPRECNADRTSGRLGFCRASDRVFVAKTMLHKFEEPPICGKGGAGAVFFSGCSLRCIYCQNHVISRCEYGKEYTAAELCDAYLRLRDEGASTLDLVTPTHYAPTVIKSLELAKPRLGIPVVYNCGGYESVDTLKALDGLIDVYLPDVKYHSDALAMRFSSCGDYFARAIEALSEMVCQTGPYEEENGIAQKGVIVRHLVLPGHRDDSVAVLEGISRVINVKDIRLSLMSQYTPFYTGDAFPELRRRTTTYEYRAVLDRAVELGFTGFCQDRRSAEKEYTPDF